MRLRPSNNMSSNPDFTIEKKGYEIDLGGFRENNLEETLQ